MDIGDRKGVVYDEKGRDTLLIKRINNIAENTKVLEMMVDRYSETKR